MNNEILGRLKKLQRNRSDTNAFANYDEFLPWSDSVSPLLEFDDVIHERFIFWTNHVKSAHRSGREHHDALGEAIGLVNQAITKLELQPQARQSKDKKISEQLKYPNKVTLKWLHHNVHWTLWAWLLGLLISAFTFGVFVADTPIYKSLKSNFSGTNIERKLTHKESKSSDINLQNSLEYLSQYSGTGNIIYEGYNLSSYSGLEETLKTVNSQRIEYPMRAVDITVVQQFLDSGNLKMAYFTASQLKKKQINLAKIRR